MKPLIIGIAGGTGSGKTTLVNRLLEQFGEDISVLPHDSYYAAHHELTLEERQALNYDHPASFDTHRMIQDLRDLKAGKAVQCPVYDYTIYDRTDETVTLSPNKVILVEGILIFENKELRDQYIARRGQNTAVLVIRPVHLTGKAKRDFRPIQQRM